MAQTQQYTGFAFFPKEAWALLNGAAQGIMPNTWLPGWGVAVFSGAFFAMAGTWWAEREKQLELPVIYGGFLCEFLVLAVITTNPSCKCQVGIICGLPPCWSATA